MEQSIELGESMVCAGYYKLFGTAGVKNWTVRNSWKGRKAEEWKMG